MVRFEALIETAIGVFFLFVAILLIDPLQIPLFGVLGNAAAFPQGGTTIVLVQLIPLILAIGLIWAGFKSFREGDAQQGFVVQR